jgi:hypothetical protein
MGPEMNRAYNYIILKELKGRNSPVYLGRQVDARTMAYK